MRLAHYLLTHGIKRIDFAARLGVSPGTITAWCDGRFWPGRANTQKILKETNGAVTPNDFAEENGACAGGAQASGPTSDDAERGS